MNLLLMVGAGGTVTPEAPADPDVIEVQAERWAAGTDTTDVQIMVTVGPDTPAFAVEDLELRSVDGETTYHCYFTTRGVWPNGKPMVIGGNMEPIELTNGSPLSLKLHLNGGGNVEADEIDFSSTWVNSEAGTADWNDGGWPPGALLPSSAEHLCETNPITRHVRPEADTDALELYNGILASDVETRFVNTADTIMYAWSGANYVPSDAASYEPARAFHTKYCRTANSAYLRTAFALATSMRAWSLINQSNGDFQESQLHQDGVMLLYLLRGDTQAETWIVGRAKSMAGTSGIQALAARNAARVLKFFGNIWKLGREDEAIASVSYTCADKLDSLFLPHLLHDEEGTLIDTVPTVFEFDRDGTTVKRVVFPFQLAVFVIAVYEFCDLIPDSENKTAALAACDGWAHWLFDNGRRVSGPSWSNTLTWIYSSGELFTGAVAMGTTSASYSAGASSITIQGATPGSYGGGNSSGGAITINGESILCNNFTVAGDGTATITTRNGETFASGGAADLPVTFCATNASAPDATYSQQPDLTALIAVPLSMWLRRNPTHEDAADVAALIARCYAQITYTADGEVGPFLVVGKMKNWHLNFSWTQRIPSDILAYQEAQ